ncbi:MAG TPA: hypothetical protein VFO16_09155 [Pseudonocardiaceae bacterium]|nr:hypothetical protein [Pseudonocardiaceae bacterium]
MLTEPAVDHPLLTDVQYSQHTDLTQDLTAVRAALIAALPRIDAAGGLAWPDGRSPFLGLRSFEGDRHRAFFAALARSRN